MRSVSLLVAAFAASSPAAGEVDPLIETGRRIYEEGILPGGGPLVATRPEGFVVEGRYAACGTCHRPSGMGSIEGVTDQAILVPPLAGPVLFAPGRFAHSFLDDSHHYVPNETWRRAMTRPAYNESVLDEALRSGTNSAGDLMAAPMPLYELEPHALAALTAYLRQLGREPDPGVEADALHIATVITPDADPDDADAILGVLRSWAESARSANKRWRLHEWRLVGRPETWPAQLQAHYKKQNVFALLSGLGASEWRPVHDFCEAHRVACILPSVDVAPSATGHFSMYYSAGVPLEGGILAEHLQRPERAPRGRILHLYSREAGRRAVAAFETHWGESGDGRESLAVRHHVTAPGAALHEVNDEDTLVLWLDADDVTQLASQSNAAPAREIYLSALLASPEDVVLPDDWKRASFFVTLFDDLGLQGEIARLRLERWLEQNGLDLSADRRLQADAYAAAYLFNAAIAEIKREEIRRPEVPLTRAHLLEEFEERLGKYDDGTQFIDTESHVAWYGRMSLGPGQRIAVRGGSIVQYESTDSNRVVRVGDRIVPKR